MKLSRAQKRWFNRNSAEGKRIQKLGTSSKEKLEFRSQSIISGKQQADSFTRSIQEKHIEKLEQTESELIKELKSKKISQTDIDKYMDIWAGIKTWPKPNDYHALRKELKKLNKEYGING